MLILGIDTSCDDTSAAVIKDGSFVLSNVVSSQTEIHREFGGVVPEVAARHHIELIIPVIKQALAKANITKEQIDLIAITNGPGLITSLMVGIDTAKSLAYSLNKKIIAINHLEGHIYANWLENKNKIIFPALCLIVSGGHTELVIIKDHLNYQVIGQTRDDAAGEAFDKVAKLLNIGYPGGPIISKLADNGDNQAYNFPRPMINSKDFDFSFSGLKTEILKLTKKHPNLDKQQINNICASFQKAVVDTLVFKTIKAAKEYHVKTIMLGGGVSANKCLRKDIKQKIQQEIPNSHFSLLKFQFTSDNGAMIAAAAYQHAIRKKFTDFIKIAPETNLIL
ncbi:MAG: tRNA (adenosine(37)-N6)-threonylcarbamoyltransferase complex transferase subunit TsaD [Patescibacteria group bacterium]|nr:tRNA (adenosine(37)-N6)-threonylcarbamoyltransferase complex transferase subunit TsaD [Patescibacteria group bacterium]